jgi:hypothetical protein
MITMKIEMASDRTCSRRGQRDRILNLTPELNLNPVLNLPRETN